MNVDSIRPPGVSPVQHAHNRSLELALHIGAGLILAVCVGAFFALR